MSVIASDVASTTTQYVDDSVEPETAYSYAVVAVNDAAEGPASAIATTETDPLPVVIVNSNPGNGARSVARNGTLPATATGLTLTASFDWVTLSWDTMADASIIDYRIWRGPNASNMQVLVNNTESLSTDYIDSTVEPNTKYRYAVAAINANGVGPQSSSKITTLNLIVGRSHSVVADGSVTLVSNLGYVASSGTRPKRAHLDELTTVRTKPSQPDRTLTDTRLQPSSSDSKGSKSQKCDLVANSPGGLRVTQLFESTFQSASTTVVCEAPALPWDM